MTIDEIIELVSGFGGVLAFTPTPGDGTPEIAWGDTFFYYAPDGVMPQATQPFATVVTKDYPGDERSRLDRDGAFRLNIAAGTPAFLAQTGFEPRDLDKEANASIEDTLMAHPVYGSLAWLSVVNPGESSGAAVRSLLEEACTRAKSRWDRRATL